MEEPASDVMKRPPHGTKGGVPVILVIIENPLYGFVTGVTPIVASVVITSSCYNGDLGTEL